MTTKATIELSVYDVQQLLRAAQRDPKADDETTAAINRASFALRRAKQTPRQRRV